MIVQFSSHIWYYLRLEIRLYFFWTFETPFCFYLKKKLSSFHRKSVWLQFSQFWFKRGHGRARIFFPYWVGSHKWYRQTYRVKFACVNKVKLEKKLLFFSSSLVTFLFWLCLFTQLRKYTIEFTHPRNSFRYQNIHNRKVTWFWLFAWSILGF